MKNVYGDFSLTLDFVKHFFGEQVEMGLDYLQLLNYHPNQKLPVLCLVSNENNTGKTTFVKWLKLMFLHRMTIIGKNDLVKCFNYGWAEKQIVCCDECFLEKSVLKEIKSITTSNIIIVNKPREEMKKIGKVPSFILVSNLEENFLHTRFWVRKIEKPQTESKNLLYSLESQLPPFLFFLSRRQLTTKQKNMLWFNPYTL